ncbi:MAG: TonB-dependent receptor [Ignavibacteriaceae bacterium]|nr:TonB-dependent receptor [Ignavibacteriaceae bacterium]
MRKLFFIIAGLLFSIGLYAQSGKISGKVTDVETGEPLIGASVMVQGTNLGSATNLNGEYIILNVSPGKYSVVAKYVGYRQVETTNLNVSVNLTTEVNFKLPSEAFKQDEVIVVAERPLVNKNVTNATSIVRTEDIKNLPIRGVNAVVAQQTGVVEKGGNLYIRGSRSDAVAFYIDGVLVNNPVFGGSRASTITNAIEEIQVQAGGYSAEFGGANGGIVSTQTKSGSEKYSLTAEAITDAFAKPGNKYLGGYSYGYSEYVITMGGPIIPDYKGLKFFFAGNNVFQKTPARFEREYNFTGLFDPANPKDTFDIVYPEGMRLNQAANTYQGQGNLTWDLGSFSVRLNGNYTYSTSRGGVGWTGIVNKNNASLDENRTITSSVKITHVLSSTAFYDVIFNYFGDFYVTMDPIFKHNISLYGDSVANAQYGRSLLADGQLRTGYQAYGFDFAKYETPFRDYRKQKTSSFGGKINFLYQLGKHHELKAGGEVTNYTIRRYSLNARAIASNVKSVADGDIRLIYNRLDNYGYDVYGNTSDGGTQAPKQPIFAAAYIQDKMEFPDLVLNVGFRLDYINTDSREFLNPSNVQFDASGIIDPAYMKDVKPTVQISPRLGFSFPVTDKTVFHAQYGKFIQQSQLSNIYRGFNVSSDIIKGGYAELNPVGYGLKPERTTQYDIGFKQQLGDNFAFDITGFYKDIKDQIQLRTTFAEATAQHTKYYSLLNGDFSTVKGIEFKIDLRRTQRIYAAFDYTYSDAEGTGSTPTEAGRGVWQSPTGEPFLPVQIAPLSFNQAHRGSLNIDYRFDKNDGPELFGSKFLEQAGFNLLFTFNSGSNYTQYTGYGNTTPPTEVLNSSTTPWNYQLDGRFDKSFQVSGLNINIYLWVVNLLNTKNVIDVFGQTGDAYDDGYLATEVGRTAYENFKKNPKYGQKGADTYKQLYLASIYTADNFGTPRQIRLGIRLDY